VLLETREKDFQLPTEGLLQGSMPLLSSIRCYSLTQWNVQLQGCQKQPHQGATKRRPSRSREDFK
jgi:hypothetical protein